MSLDGITAVVTRPAHQGRALCAAIERRGGNAIALPVIDIQPPADEARFARELARLADFDIAIFTSANAVDAVAEALGSAHPWPERTVLAAVGRATANALTRHGLPVTLVAPPPFSSESLLSLPALQRVAGKRVVILRGQQGRALLGDTLRQRGAEVSHVESYRRIPGRPDPAPLYRAWEAGCPVFIVVTSNEGLENLVGLVDAPYHRQLFNTQLIVVSQRALPLAARLGFVHPPLVASEASNNAIVCAMEDQIQQRAQRGPRP